MAVYELPKVSSGVWCMSASQPGTVITDIEVYKQRVYLVLNTPLGSDPFRPFFGCNYREYIDRPAPIAAVQIKKEIIEAITIWVPEVKLDKITYVITAGKIVFTIKILVNGQTLVMPFSPIRTGFFSGIEGVKIVNREFPYDSTVVSIAMTVDGVAVTFPGTIPWTNMETMLAWLKENKGMYGTWGMSKDELILYTKSNYKKVEMSLTKVS